MRSLFLAAALLLFGGKAFSKDAQLPLMTVEHVLLHKETVTNVSISQNGEHALTLTAKELHVWSLATGSLERTISVKDCNALHSISMSHDGRLVAVSDGKNVVLVDTLDWQEKRRISLGDLSYHKNLSFSPDGKFLLMGGFPGFFYKNPLLWNLATDKVQLRLEVEGWPSSVAFNSDGTRLFAGSHRGISVHDTATGAELGFLPGNSETALSRLDGRVAGIGYFYDGVRVWDIGPRLLVSHIVAGPRIRFSDVALIDGGRRLLTSGTDIRLWDVATGDELSWSVIDGVEPHHQMMGRIAVSQDETLVVSSFKESKKAMVFNLAGQGKALIPTPVARDASVRSTPPLILAVRAEDNARVKSLLARGAKPDEMDGWADRRGKTALHYAKSAEVVEMLLAAGADVNAVDSSNVTPLHEAMKRYHPGNSASRKVVQFLVENGASVNASRQGNHAATPIQVAAAGRHREMVEWLRNHGAAYDPQSVVWLDDIEHLEREILAGRIDPILFRSEYGRRTLLHLARSPAAVDMLVKHGAPLEELDAWKATPLFSALGNRRPEVARAIINNGAKTDGKWPDGSSLEEVLNRLESD